MFDSCVAAIKFLTELIKTLRLVLHYWFQSEMLW